MTSANDPDRVVLHYFVDEAGTPTLFRRRRESIVGQEGCSNFFILGKLEIDEPQVLQRRLQELRAELLADPYFKNVPSMRAEQKKTALAFHAKDDLPEVRYRVLKLLEQEPVSFYAVVRDKHRVLAEVLARNKADESYLYRENELYDELVAHLFKSRFYRADHFVHASTPRQSGGLQAVDYFLWALQRLYEQGEDRYWETIQARVKVVYDRDDMRTASYGTYYTPDKPLTLEARAKK